MDSETPKQRPSRRGDPSEPAQPAPRGRAHQGAGGTPALAGASGDPGHHAPRPSPFRAVTGTKRFLEESVAELKKVEWPKQNQVMQGTGVVLFACFVVGLFLYISDQAFKRLVENVFLGQ